MKHLCRCLYLGAQRCEDRCGSLGWFRCCFCAAGVLVTLAPIAPGASCALLCTHCVASNFPLACSPHQVKSCKACVTSGVSAGAAAAWRQGKGVCGGWELGVTEHLPLPKWRCHHGVCATSCSPPLPVTSTTSPIALLALPTRQVTEPRPLVSPVLAFFSASRGSTACPSWQDSCAGSAGQSCHR